MLSGIVQDENGAPLAGVAISDNKTGKKTATTTNGAYNIAVEEGSVLHFSYVGLTAQDVPVAEELVVNVKMRGEVNVLNEVVAVGYQKVRKSDFTGSVSSVKAKELNLATPSLGQALVGKVAGVQVSQTDGSPYGGIKIRVRGVGSINTSTEPLYVIDGYPAGNDVYINPNDIESIDILKDAASAAIYGSRAAGGVVLITTKRGKEGKGRLDYDFQVGVDQLSKKVKLLNSAQFVDLVVDARNNSYRDLMLNTGHQWSDANFSDDNKTRVNNVGNAGSVQIPVGLYDYANQKVIAPTINTDWQDALYRNALFTRHNLAFTGGAKGVRYAISGGYQNQDGIMVNTGQKRTNFRANIDGDVNAKLKVGANIAYTANSNKETQVGRWDHSPVFGALIYMPNLPVYNADGSLATNLAAAQANDYGYQSIENPVATAERTRITRTGSRGTYNAYATYELLKNLVFKTNLGYQTYNEKYDYYLPTSLSAGIDPPYSPNAIAAANAVAQTTGQKDQLAEFTLNYNKQLGKNSLNVLAGYTAQQTYTDVVTTTAKGFQNDLIPEVTAGAPGQIAVTGGKSTYTLNSYLARVLYNYDGKYFASAAFRTDGSSRFGVDRRWGSFPSVSAGWNISKESFYQDWLGNSSSLRLRASWGLSGNNNIGNYSAVQTMASPGGVALGTGNVISTAYWPGQITDNRLGWESTSQYNFGADLSLFKNRVSIIANYYISQTRNLLFNNNVSAISGGNTILTNLRNSKVQNKGWDFQVDAKAISSRDFNLNVSGNISINRNKVLSLGGASTIITAGAERSYLTHITQQGQPVGMFYGYQVAGMVREKDMAGIAADDAVYKANNKSFPKGYQLQGPARSLAQTNPLKPGDLYFKDVNKDGVVDANDLGIIGSPYAKFTYGFNIGANYKRISFNASFNGSYGNKILDGQDYYLFNMEGSGNQYSVVDDRYRNESRPGNGSVYRASRAGTQSNSTRLSTFYLQSGSFLRCTDLTLAYEIPGLDKLTNNTLTGVRVFASVSNAFTISKYKGYNPEVDYNYSNNASGANATPGVDYGVYPLVRAFNVGAKLSF
ncbi:TonB-dependent receptor [Deminuibacter soli]|uniref:TonB-dependent receptor n=2 Tax=Deminuibacter soli TaxID=2291815 RepID=A0A3E1NDZ5_9BACT|nr:TonB-dependent receptor [Deminuibacter soli]